MTEQRSFKITIDKYLPIYYAGASGDFNPIHIDPDFGKKVGLGGIVLQGMCTMGIVAGLLLGDRDPTVLKSLKVRFIHPVYPQDELTIDCEREGRTETFNIKNQKGKYVIRNGVAIYR